MSTPKRATMITAAITAVAITVPSMDPELPPVHVSINRKNKSHACHSTQCHAIIFNITIPKMRVVPSIRIVNIPLLAVTVKQYSSRG